jgi:hypothetical protein
MQLSDIIRAWHTLATGGEVDRSDIFFRFVALWVAFNARYASRHSSDVGDWDQVRSFAGDPDAVDRHRELVRTDAEYVRAIDTLGQRGIRNLNGYGTRRIRDRNSLTDVASCVYQVRCNLFHGGKTPEDPRDARLVEASHTIVLKLIEPFVGAEIGAFHAEPGAVPEPGRHTGSARRGGAARNSGR